MTNDEYTAYVRALIYCEPDIVNRVLGLCGEAGEVAELFKKDIRVCKRQPLDLDKLKSELGDVLFYLTSIADTYGLTLENLMDSNITKLNDRHCK